LSYVYYITGQEVKGQGHSVNSKSIRE